MWWKASSNVFAPARSTARTPRTRHGPRRVAGGAGSGRFGCRLATTMRTTVKLIGLRKPTPLVAFRGRLTGVTRHTAGRNELHAFIVTHRHCNHMRADLGRQEPSRVINFGLRASAAPSLSVG